MRNEKQLRAEYHRAQELGGAVLSSFNRSLTPSEQQTMDAILGRRASTRRDAPRNKAFGAPDTR